MILIPMTYAMGYLLSPLSGLKQMPFGYRQNGSYRNEEALQRGRCSALKRRAKRTKNKRAQKLAQGRALIFQRANITVSKFVECR